MGISFLRAAALAAALFATPALAAPSLLIDADTGQVISQTDATQPWYPASLTKLMTTYVALSAVREGRLTLDTPLIVSARAARMPPSKMGFRPGVKVTLDNALKMLMVHSPNDVAITVAEGVSGSVEAFAGEMNAAAARLGLHESHFVNPNGLHDPAHYSSARDLAMIARALLTDFPEETDLFSIPGFQLGNRIYANHNGLLGRYPGADGMKTGFTCAAGFNLVASATRSGRRVIAVVLGSPSGHERNDEAAQLLDQGFSSWGGTGATLASLPTTGGSPPNMRSEICVARNRQATADAEVQDTFPTTGIFGRNTIFAMFSGAAPMPASPGISTVRPMPFDPIPLFIGPKDGWTGVALGPRKPGPMLMAKAPKPVVPDEPAPAVASGPAPASADTAAAPLALIGASPSIAADLPAAIKGPVKSAKKSKKARPKALPIDQAQ